MKPLPVSDESTLGPYRLLRKLGEGGMGTVFLAHDPALARNVAIKLLRQFDHASHSPAAMAKRFMREARSVAQLNHPHVVTIHNIGQTEGSPPRPYLVMEFVEGGSLADELHTHGPLDWRSATLAIRDALLGLAAAHEANIIHRDLKPANLMRTQKGAIKLVDFGLARLLESAQLEGDLTFPGAFVGSPSYASPEQAAGSLTLDARSDLYSLAATWYTLIAGQPPFVHEDPAEILRSHLDHPFPDLRKFTQIPNSSLFNIMDRASQKLPKDRYPSAQEMLRDIDTLLNDHAKHYPAATPIPRSPKPIPLPAEQTITDLKSRLESARLKTDSSTQLAALRSLFGLYRQLDRRDDATKVFREALVLHVQMNTPAHRSSN